MNVVLPDRSVREIGPDSCTIETLLSRFGIRPPEVVVAVNGKVVPEDAIVGGDDNVRIIRIAHGG